MGGGGVTFWGGGGIEWSRCEGLLRLLLAVLEGMTMTNVDRALALTLSTHTPADTSAALRGEELEE